jgi:predicted MPP superfamily phosphohydrolase
VTPAAIRSWAPNLLIFFSLVVAVLWLNRRFPRRFGRRTSWVLVALSVAWMVLLGRASYWIWVTSIRWMLGAIELSLLVAGTIVAVTWSVIGLEALLALPRLWSRVLALREKKANPSIDSHSTEVMGDTRREAIAKIGAGVIAGVGVTTVAWGALRTRLDVEVVEIPIRLARLPRALDGFSIVQLSDIHIGTFFGEARLREAEDVVRRLKPDLVAMTGDLIDIQPIWIPAGASFLSRLVPLSRHGVVAIRGNHEHYAGALAVEDALRRAGIDALFNEGRLVAPSDGGGFALVGVDDVSSYEHHMGPGPRVAAPLAALPADRARVLLCHQPSYLPTAAAHGFDLMLSGHTHGGQIAVAGTALVGAVFAEYSGLGRLGDTQVYVNRGLGTSGPPVRVAIRPEITKIVLVAG